MSEPFTQKGRRMRIVYPVCALMLLTACGMVPTISLKHPTTGRTVQCEGDLYPLFDPTVGQLIKSLQQNCVADYQKRGYEQVPQSETGRVEEKVSGNTPPGA